MRYHLLNKKHPFVSECDAWNHTPPPGLSTGMQNFWKKHSLFNCDGAVIATEHGKMVGFFRFVLEGKKYRVLYAAGTYVIPSYRHRKVAQKMWRRALRHIKPTTVEVHIASQQGARLMGGLIQRGIKWYLSPYNRKVEKILKPLRDKYDNVHLN